MIASSHNLLEVASSMLKKYALCDYCLGRQFAKLLPGLGNKLRGKTIKSFLAMDANLRILNGEESAKDTIKALAENGMDDLSRKLASSFGIEFNGSKLCSICNNKLSDDIFSKISNKILEELCKYDYSTFLVGAIVPIDVREMEDRIKAEFGITYGEEIKSDIKREIGKLIQIATGKIVNFNNPDVMVLIDIFSESFEIKVNPLFIKGYYRKFVPNIPQSTWICRRCKGDGCESCNFTGKEYETSVSELIGEPALKLFEALSYKFHAAGREDVDALVLGTGRPFVLELKYPKKRSIPLDELERVVNELANGKIEVWNLTYASRKDVRDIKARSSIAPKVYNALVEFDSDIDEDKLRKLCDSLKDIVVTQRTPTRVLRRRGDKVRKKYLYFVEAEKKGDRLVEFKIKVQGGLYVKELISGDYGRTVPNFAEILGATPKSIKLSILEIEE